MKSKTNGVYLSIVIPAYNEEKRLGASLDRILAFLRDVDYRYEIVVVDDGSSDGTAQLARGYSERHREINLLRNEKNRGKGYTVRHGILAAQGEIILFTDADLAVPIEKLHQFVDACEGGADVAIGDRYMEESDIRKNQPLYRRIIGYGGGFFVRIILLKKAPDTQCGFKCLRRSAALRLFQVMRINGGMFDVELLYLAHKWGYQIVRVPVVWSHCPGSNINIVKCVLTDPFSLFSIRINDLLGKYRVACVQE